MEDITYSRLRLNGFRLWPRWPTVRESDELNLASCHPIEFLWGVYVCRRLRVVDPQDVAIVVRTKERFFYFVLKP